MTTHSLFIVTEIKKWQLMGLGDGRSIFSGAHVHVGGDGSDGVHLDEKAMMQLFCRDQCTR